MAQRNRTQPLYGLYPEEDGSAIAENTRQWRWIVTVAGGLKAVFAARPDVFVAGNLLWYPVEGRPEIRTAPDALVAFGRPKGDRGSYLQWLEGGVAPQVVFEILSPGNRPAELVRKFQFYERYGVEEYYLYDPEENQLLGWWRVAGALAEIDPMDGWVSPRLGLRFVLGVEELELYQADGSRLPTYNDVIFGQARLREEAQRERERAAVAQQEAAQAQQEAAQAQQEAAQAQQEAAQARQAAELERERATQEHERAERLAARLRTMGIDPEEDRQ